MTVKDRRIHILLQIFFLLVGLYQFIQVTASFQNGLLSTPLFEFSQGQLPVIYLIASVIAGLGSLISTFSLWQRTPWAYGFTLFNCGLLFSLHLLNLNEALMRNSYEIIPIFFILIVLLQSFPYLIRRSYRSV